MLSELSVVGLVSQFVRSSSSSIQTLGAQRISVASVGDGAPATRAKGRGRFRKTGWCYPPESLLRAEADSGGDDDGPALVRPGASPPRSPRGAAPSGGERWPSARTRKVGGDRSAPRVDRFVLAPLVKIMRAALARRDHPRAAAAAALVLTATRGRDGEPRDDDPNARSVTVGHWTRGSRERAEYGEAEHAAIHAAIEILRETGGAPPPEAPAPDDDGGASRLGATSTSGQTRGRLLQPPPPSNNNNIKITQPAPLTKLTPEEEIRLLELARRCTKRGTDANEEDLVRIATVYDEKLNDTDRAVAELSRDERATVPPKGSKGGARRVPHSYKRLRCVALIRHRAWLRQSRFVNASADADEGEKLRVPLNATGSTATGPPGGRTWSHFERVRIESLAKDAEDAIGEPRKRRTKPASGEIRGWLRLALRFAWRRGTWSARGRCWRTSRRGRTCAGASWRRRCWRTCWMRSRRRRTRRSDRSRRTRRARGLGIGGGSDSAATRNRAATRTRIRAATPTRRAAARRATTRARRSSSASATFRTRTRWLSATWRFSRLTPNASPPSSASPAPSSRPRRTRRARSCTRTTSPRRTRGGRRRGRSAPRRARCWRRCAGGRRRRPPKRRRGAR